MRSVVKYRKRRKLGLGGYPNHTYVSDVITILVVYSNMSALTGQIVM